MSDRKVFCIGFQRTGTGSLNDALNLLGIRSKHNAQPLFRDLGHPMLRDYDGFSDNPMPLLYPQLDALFPGSKFILTRRPVERWLASVEWLFTKGRIKNEWHRKPIVDEIHRSLYGVTHFEREVFRARYLRHEDEVRAYFRDRPADLLVIDLGVGEPWAALCSFLDRPVPDRPFPHANRQSSWWRWWPRLVRRRALRWLRGTAAGTRTSNEMSERGK